MPLTCQRVLLIYCVFALCFLLVWQGYPASAAPVYSAVNVFVAVELSGPNSCSSTCKLNYNTQQACQDLRATKGLYSLNNKRDAYGATVKQWGDAPPTAVGQTTWDNLVCWYNGTTAPPDNTYSCFAYVAVGMKVGVNGCCFCGLKVSPAVPAPPDSEPASPSPQPSPAPGPAGHDSNDSRKFWNNNRFLAGMGTGIAIAAVLGVLVFLGIKYWEKSHIFMAIWRLCNTILLIYQYVSVIYFGKDLLKAGHPNHAHAAFFMIALPFFIGGILTGVVARYSLPMTIQTDGQPWIWHLSPHSNCLKSALLLMYFILPLGLVYYFLLHLLAILLSFFLDFNVKKQPSNLTEKWGDDLAAVRDVASVLNALFFSVPVIIIQIQYVGDGGLSLSRNPTWLAASVVATLLSCLWSVMSLCLSMVARLQAREQDAQGTGAPGSAMAVDTSDTQHAPSAAQTASKKQFLWGLLLLGLQIRKFYRVWRCVICGLTRTRNECPNGIPLDKI